MTTLCKRVLGLASKVDLPQTEIDRWDPNVCVEAASTPPSSWFIDPDFYKTEKRAIFTKNWVAVGRVDQVAEPGQYFSGSHHHSYNNNMLLL